MKIQLQQIKKGPIQTNMNKLQKLRRKIIQNKRKSLYISHPIDQCLVKQINFEKEKKNISITQSNFSLFPLLTSSDIIEDNQNMQNKDRSSNDLSSRIEIRHYLKQKKGHSLTAREEERRNRKLFFHSVKNQNELMAKTVAPAVRFNQSFQNRKQTFSRSEKINLFSANNGQSAVNFEELNKIKTNPQRKSPLKRFSRQSIRGRRTSPTRKNYSPIRKTSICPWQIGEDFYPL